MIRYDSRPAVLAAGAIACAIIVWAFLPGLSAGFQLDDGENFKALHRYLAGDITTSAVLTGNRSGPLGRPVAMASFLLDARLWGVDPVAFLRTNVVLHLLCAALVALVAARLLLRQTDLGAGAAALAGIAFALWWASLPIHASVVLYAVQRMAILSTLFVLAALACYVAGRVRIEQGRSGWFPLWFVLFPAFTLLAALSKENGVLAPALAAAIEIGWFRNRRTLVEHRRRLAFFGLFLVLPGLVAVAALVADPSIVMAGYAARDFTLAERLLTQPRILWDYVGQILLPFGPSMGLIHDDLQKSQSLLQPPATLLTLLAWLGVVAGAFAARRVAPGVLGGVLLFLAGHIVESTVLPLELYFEHRNYLPSAGVLVAVASLAIAAGKRLPTPTVAFARTGPILALAMLLTYAAATHARARVWGDPAVREAQAVAQNPHSPRLRARLAVAAASAGDLPGALEHIAMAASAPSPPSPRTLALLRLTAACLSDRPLPDPGPLEVARAPAQQRILLAEMAAFESLAQRTETRACRWPVAADALAVGYAMLEGSPQDATDHEMWRTRYNVARLLASQSDFGAAAREAQAAWEASAWNAGVGVLVFQLHATRGDLAASRATLQRLRETVGSGDLATMRAIGQFEAYVDSLATPSGDRDQPSPQQESAHP